MGHASGVGKSLGLGTTKLRLGMFSREGDLGDSGMNISCRACDLKRDWGWPKFITDSFLGGGRDWRKGNIFSVIVSSLPGEIKEKELSINEYMRNEKIIMEGSRWNLEEKRWRSCVVILIWGDVRMSWIEPSLMCHHTCVKCLALCSFIFEDKYDWNHHVVRKWFGKN